MERPMPTASAMFHHANRLRKAYHTVLAPLCRAAGDEGFWKLLGESLGTCERAEEAWREAAMWRGFNVLGEREREIILLCGSGLGISPSEPQLNAAQRAYEEAFSRGEELDREAAAKGGMFTKVGVLMGIGAALLLI